MHIQERFWSKVDLTNRDGCWNWTAGSIKHGYGTFYAGPGKHVLAHRFSYETLVGDIPEGLVCDHLCRNPPCVNPDHIELVSLAENTRRGDAGRRNREKTHCKHGHEFTEENTYWYDNGTRRRCKKCGQRWGEEWNAQKKDERHARGLRRPAIPGAGRPRSESPKPSL